MLRVSVVSCLFVMLLGAVRLRAAEIDDIRSRFDQPPDNTRMMVRWWWFGPAVTKAGLEAEMKHMKEGGLGGFEVQPTYPLSLDDEKAGIKNMKFLSPEFLDMLGFAAQKAHELGLRMDLTLGSGWPYGGPQFSASEAAGRIKTQTVSIQKGQKSVRVPAARGGQKVIAAFIGPLKNVPAGGNPYKEVPISEGAAQLPADLGGATQITFYLAGQTGMQVKRPAYGAEGNVLDHYSPAVVAKFIKQIAEPEVRACGANPPYAVFCDSLEVGGEDWTPNFLDEFQKRRGYDLRPYLPALFNNVGPKTVEIRHDWGKTITEIFNDYFVRDLEKWAKANGTRFRIQAYGTPPANLTSYAERRSARGRGPRLERLSGDPLGVLGQPPAGPPRLQLRDLYLAPFARLPRQPSGHEGRSRPARLARGQPDHRAWLALHAAGSGVSRLAVLCLGRVRRQEPLVDRDARRAEVPAAGLHGDARGPAGQRRGPVSGR